MKTRRSVVVALVSAVLQTVAARDGDERANGPALGDDTKGSGMKRATRRRARVGAGLTLVAALALTACGADTTTSGGVGVGAQPLGNGTFAPGVFVDLPKPGGSRPYGGPTLRHGTWVQSFEVDGLSPMETMQFFQSALRRRWEADPPPLPLGGCFPPGGASGTQCTYRGTWIRGTERLEIVAGPAGLGLGNTTELSLLLEGA